MNFTLRSLYAIATMGLLASLYGCGGLRIHNEVRDKQGVEAKEAWAKVDIAAVIAAERRNLAQLLETELATQDKLALAIRDHTLRAMVDGASVDEVLFKPVDAQLTKLVGSDGLKKVDAALAAQSTQRVWAAQSAERQEVWDQLRLGRAAPRCVDLLDEGSEDGRARRSAINAAVTSMSSDTDAIKKRKVLGGATLEDLKELCKRKPTADPFAAMAGALRQARLRHETDLELATAAQVSLRTLTVEYEAAAKAYTDALPTGDASASAKTAAALKRLQNAIKALERAPDALSQQFLSKERLQSLSDFIDAVTQATADGKLPADANKATVAFALFPTLVDDAKKSLADARAPLALPLLMQRNHEQLRLEAVTREVAARDAMQRISEAIVNTTFDQATQLALAKRELDTVGGLSEVKGKATAEAFKSAPPTARTSLYRGTALYLDALNRLEARRYKLEYQYIAAEHELQLAYAEVNAKQWSALIGVAVDQVAAASAGGIKPDRVVALLNTLGVFYIGHGVNK